MPASNATAQWTADALSQFLYGHTYPLTTVIALLLPILYYVIEFVAYTWLWRQARRGRLDDISLQTCVALAVCPTLAVIIYFTYGFVWECLILQRVYLPIGWWLLMLTPAAVSVVAWASCALVSKQGDRSGDDNLIDEHWPRWAQWSTVYVASAVLAVVVSCTVSYLTSTSMFTTDFALVSTFMNFLHGFALLPQLVLSRRRGFVGPNALRFLLLLGIKHVMEFVIDVRTSSFVMEGRGSHKDAGCLLGDMISAMLLLDFMYLWALNAVKFRGKKNNMDTLDLTTGMV